MSEPGVSKLWPLGQMQPTTWLLSVQVYWKTALFVYVLPIAAFTNYNSRAELLQQRPDGPQSQNYLLSDSLQGRFVNPCSTQPLNTSLPLLLRPVAQGVSIELAVLKVIEVDQGDTAHAKIKAFPHGKTHRKSRGK